MISQTDFELQEVREMLEDWLDGASYTETFRIEHAFHLLDYLEGKIKTEDFSYDDDIWENEAFHTMIMLTR